MDVTIGVLVFVILLLVVNVVAIGGLLRHFDKKESRLLKTISSMADRLQAKDLTGYLAVKEAQEQPAPTFAARDDETEARLEHMRRG